MSKAIPSHRPLYSEKQISKYFSHISLPQDLQELYHTSSLHKNSNETLHFLTQLQRHQLATAPFENLQLHYSSHHTISLDPGYLYSKIVEEDNRGGYCMENNCFFGTVLRSLGFTVHNAGARVSHAVTGDPAGGFECWCHMINIVTLSDGKKYMLDVGFGGNGPIQPLLLDPEHSHSQYIPPAEVRLIYDNIPDNTDPNQKLWIYQHRIDPDAPWVPMYCFTELEFLPSDYEMMNMRTSQSRTSFFTYRVMVVKMILEQGEVVGTLMLVGAEVKRRVRGKAEHIMTCKTEVERVQALGKWFGIRLREDEKAGIKGMVTELHGESNIGD